MKITKHPPLDINNWAKVCIINSVRDIKYYVSQGMSKEHAIRLAREDTTLSAMLFERVIQEVQSV